MGSVVDAAPALGASGSVEGATISTACVTDDRSAASRTASFAEGASPSRCAFDAKTRPSSSRKSCSGVGTVAVGASAMAAIDASISGTVDGRHADGATLAARRLALGRARAVAELGTDGLRRGIRGCAPPRDFNPQGWRRPGCGGRRDRARPFVSPLDSAYSRMYTQPAHEILRPELRKKFREV